MTCYRWTAAMAAALLLASASACSTSTASGENLAVEVSPTPSAQAEPSTSPESASSTSGPDIAESGNLDGDTTSTRKQAVEAAAQTIRDFLEDWVAHGPGHASRFLIEDQRASEDTVEPALISATLASYSVRSWKSPEDFTLLVSMDMHLITNNTPLSDGLNDRFVTVHPNGTTGAYLLEFNSGPPPDDTNGTGGDPDPGSNSSIEISSDAVTVRNRTGVEIWIVLPFGNRGRVEPGKTLVIGGPCGYRPLRAETPNGTVIAYLTGPCTRQTWTITSTDPYPPDNPTTSGVLQGDLFAMTPDGLRAVNWGGITVEGPVTRTVSVDDHGHFEIRLPAGTYTVSGGSTTLPGGRTDYHCQADATVAVSVQSTISATVKCNS